MERQKDSLFDRWIDGYTVKQINRLIYRKADREINKFVDIQLYIYITIQIASFIDRQRYIAQIFLQLYIPAAKELERLQIPLERQIGQGMQGSWRGRPQVCHFGANIEIPHACLQCATTMTAIIIQRTLAVSQLPHKSKLTRGVEGEWGAGGDRRSYHARLFALKS